MSEIRPMGIPTTHFRDTRAEVLKALEEIRERLDRLEAKVPHAIRVSGVEVVVFHDVLGWGFSDYGKTPTLVVYSHNPNRVPIYGDDARRLERLLCEQFGIASAQESVG